MRVFAAVPALLRCYDLVPIMSDTAAETDTRFGTAAQHIRRLMELCGKHVITTIAEAEPLGPKLPLDALLIAPCTGNTLAKLAHSITDSSVTMAAKAHLRNGRPLVLAFSTNDGLSGSAENIGKLLNRKNVYFVPSPLSPGGLLPPGGDGGGRPGGSAAPAHPAVNETAPCCTGSNFLANRPRLCYSV